MNQRKSKLHLCFYLTAYPCLLTESEMLLWPCPVFEEAVPDLRNHKKFHKSIAILEYILEG